MRLNSLWGLRQGVFHCPTAQVFSCVKWAGWRECQGWRPHSQDRKEGREFLWGSTVLLSQSRSLQERMGPHGRARCSGWWVLLAARHAGRPWGEGAAGSWGSPPRCRERRGKTNWQLRPGCPLWEEGCAQVQVRLGLEGAHNQGNVVLREGAVEPVGWQSSLFCWKIRPRAQPTT